MRLYYYYFSFIIGLTAAIVCSISAGKKIGLQKRDAAMYTVTGFISGVIGAVIMAQIYNGVLQLASNEEHFTPSRFSLYGGLLLVPLLTAIPAKLTGIRYGTVLDTCAAGVYLLLGTAKTGCAVYGCCYGIECAHGVTNPLTGTKVFPVQLLETLLCFGIAAVLYRITISKKRTCGTVYPLGLVIYGTLRFFVQFLRAHEMAAEADLVGFMDLWQTVSLITVTAGLVWLAAVKHKAAKA